MKRLYAVEVVYEVIVVAESEHHAESEAESSTFRITSDCEPRCQVMHEVTRLEQVCMLDWELAAEPYGPNEENFTISEWLEEIATRRPPERDTKTLPLFPAEDAANDERD